MDQYARAHVYMEDDGDHDVFYPDLRHASAALSCTCEYSSTRS